MLRVIGHAFRQRDPGSDQQIDRVDDDLGRHLVRGERLGPLAGVPFTVKANIHVAGSAATHGIPAFREMVAAADSPPVARLRAAGAIPIGRTNMADLAMGFHTTSRLYGGRRKSLGRLGT